jgi:hypothetical protein
MFEHVYNVLRQINFAVLVEHLEIIKILAIESGHFRLDRNEQLRIPTLPLHIDLSAHFIQQTQVCYHHWRKIEILLLLFFIIIA